MVDYYLILSRVGWHHGIFVSNLSCIGSNLVYRKPSGAYRQKMKDPPSIFTVIKSYRTFVYNLFILPQPLSTKRLVLAFLYVIFNFVIAIWLSILKWSNPSKTVSDSIFIILGLNLLIYLVFFVLMKWRKEPRKANMEALFHAFVSLAFAGIAIGFYLQGNTSRDLTPPESRNLNNECVFMTLFDNHDLWHFFSAGSIFFALVTMLTVDDLWLDEPRDKIAVF